MEKWRDSQIIISILIVFIFVIGIGELKAEERELQEIPHGKIIEQETERMSKEEFLQEIGTVEEAKDFKKETLVEALVEEKALEPAEKIEALPEEMNQLRPDNLEVLNAEPIRNISSPLNLESVKPAPIRTQTEISQGVIKELPHEERGLIKGAVSSVGPAQQPKIESAIKMESGTAQQLKD